MGVLKEKKKKPRPRECACGKAPILVSVRGGRMLSCPDPVKCPANLRTMWQKSEIQAVEEWNSLVAGYIAKQKRTAKAVGR